ncbi:MULTISPECIES: nitrate/sulfonate/bicarbonate ABC transporter ATP-binding protein [unclassified Pseudomonas]|uniref:ABC transporter ATP-binding protein n=1 Tax=unclassified Pseudomonas TaxID=196821 RepID=UPI000BCD37F4|nr:MULTISPECIES: nitrate/sulfonate/bicarbonate ABC transporter ATP-binding protein [unclassified Pseudomonas]PVZ20509.1 NitT/TauT family transport system ATP-binding protein [Pseudomonas sp. URIL14HWK12:I12]PVZ27575.1 NitT/TauT family transport system ATP-binding protein [Pseudomonas sp. URIL14HWK12:I10]PVZ38464.1 NitT/TauT family transport system ATP-binding protein [Pseudomonas sp. URIL14HWK12:I11]SNZ03253.1 NitT/TauT family transport system ATP-binding protein [Pseudomonas sp. URIL14HWK12:I9
MAVETLIELNAVDKGFKASDGTLRTVLEQVELRLHDREIVALLGRSGSGKSTLLRIIAGLVAADNGKVSYRGRPVHGPVAGVAMVFQSFALFPWLTVQQNVELGLEAQGVPAAERARKAGEALELIGLSGFGGALPRELSGGMRQRVGIARALVTNPEVLLMDEAFSALDVLTGQTLRDDMLELWDEQRIDTRSILVVSHNIEETVMMADRIVILSSDPGRVRAQLRIDLPRPRNADSEAVRALVAQVYGMMTQPSGATPLAAPAPAYRLPDADVERMEGVLDLLAAAPFNGKARLAQLAEETELADEAFLPICEALGILGLAHLVDGELRLDRQGQHYVKARQARRQDLFARQCRGRVPVINYVLDALHVAPDGAVPEANVLARLEEVMDSDEAERVLKVAIEWGRYAELYEYDFHTRQLRLSRE